MRSILVGEAWGEREDRFQHALVGASGRELARMLNESGLGPELPHQYPSELEMIRYWRDLEANAEIHVTNVFNQRPPNNNNEFFFEREGNKNLPSIKIKSSVKYVTSEHTHHVLRLWDTLRTLRPNLVIALGNIACWAILGKTNITAIRGTVQYSTVNGLEKQKVIPTFHPAYILRDWPKRPTVLADLDKAQREMEFSEIRRPNRWLTIADSLAEIRSWFNRPAEKYAIDIESGYALFSKAELNHITPHMRQLLSSQISMVSFARSESDGLVVQFMDRTNAEDLSFWRDSRDEAEAWKLVRRGLIKPIPKIFQNGVYDIGRFLEMGLVPTQCYEDTMLRHHAMYSEMLKGLGFLGSIYTDEIAWKTMYSNRETLKRDE